MHMVVNTIRITKLIVDVVLSSLTGVKGCNLILATMCVACACGWLASVVLVRLCQR